MRDDGDANETIYGRKLSARDIIKGTGVQVPADGQALIDVLNERSPKNLSDRPK